MYYHEETGECFELYSRGPCPAGHVLSFDYAAFRPQCRCKDDYYLHADGNCYELHTQGEIMRTQTLRRYIASPRRAYRLAAALILISRRAELIYGARRRRTRSVGRKRTVCTLADFLLLFVRFAHSQPGSSD